MKPLFLLFASFLTNVVALKTLFRHFYHQSSSKHPFTGSSALHSTILKSDPKVAASVGELKAALPRELCQIPSSYKPNLLFLSEFDEDCNVTQLVNNFYDRLNWYLNYGGRVRCLQLECPMKLYKVFSDMGYQNTNKCLSDIEKEFDISLESKRDSVFLSIDAGPLKIHVDEQVAKKNGDLHTLFNIQGRLYHDLGNFSAAIDAYTAALLLQPRSAAVFRNLGSAYHAAGNLQMAFASYQQAISLDQNGTLTFHNMMPFSH